jgi:quercetin dioxygenase-like cupin family protein
MTKIIRAAARPTKIAPAASFVGTVYQDEVLSGDKPSRMRGSRVTFTPGARTNWHTHPVGQTLFVLSGAGRYQLEGHPVKEILPGDTVVIPADARHWHGSAPGHLFSHLALSEVTETGEGTVWLEPVSDADYAKTPAAD